MFLWISTKPVLLSVLTRKGKVPRHSFPPPRSRSWLRGGSSQLAAPSWPGPQTLPSHHRWGSLVPSPTNWSSGGPYGGTRSRWLHPMQTAAIRPQRRGTGEVHCGLYPLTWGQVSCRALGRRLGSTCYLTLWLTTTTPWLLIALPH